MGFVLIGTLLALLKYFAIGPVATLSWWWVWSPFLLALMWWSYSDSSGLTAKKQMDMLDARREKRRRKAIEAMGMDYKLVQKAGGTKAYGDARNAKAAEVESEREAKRRQNEDTVTRSSTQFGSEFPASALNDLQPTAPSADERR